jgi:hypothetical protein
MPRLGEPVEPSHGESALPWWRVAGAPRPQAAADTSTAITLPKAMPWPLD